VLQKSFRITEHNFSGPQARRSNNNVGDYIIFAEPIGNFRAEFEAISIDDCRWFRLFAEN
jgi:hypothetical protein